MIGNSFVANQVLYVHWVRHETTLALLVSSALTQEAQNHVRLELIAVVEMLRK